VVVFRPSLLVTGPGVHYKSL